MHVKGEVDVICYESIMLHYIEIVHQKLALYDQEMLMIVQLSFMISWNRPLRTESYLIST